MGNWFAYTMLAVWPLIAIYLYKKQTIQLATLWVVIGGYMLLPVRTNIDLPAIPELNKYTISVLSALIGCWMIKKQRISYIRGFGKIRYLIALFFIVPFVTAALNTDAIYVGGGRSLPGLSYYDGLATVIGQFLVILPFFIGRQFFRMHEDHLLLFKFLVIGGLLYSLLILFEIRISPQLHTWIYGFFPHSFGQQLRFGGFRSVVFMGHGLQVAFFMMMVTVSAAALWRIRMRVYQFLSPTIVSYYFLTVLVLCKSVAAVIFGAFAFMFVMFTKSRIQHRIAVILVMIAMLYPAMSIMKIFPHETLTDIAVSMDEQRAQSLQFRFDNESALLERGRERFFFGWGGWGRNRLYNEDTGKTVSVTDGKWIITFGSFGILGFIAEFGLLAVAVFRAKTAAKLLKSRPEQTLFGAHALLIGIVMINQLPNASLSPWIWLFAGILLGRSEHIISENMQPSLQRKS